MCRKFVVSMAGGGFAIPLVAKWGHLFKQCGVGDRFNFLNKRLKGERESWRGCMGAVQCGAHGAHGAVHMCSCMCVCIGEGVVHVGRCGAVGRGSRCIKKTLYRSKKKINMFSSLTAWLFGVRGQCGGSSSGYSEQKVERSAEKTAALIVRLKKKRSSVKRGSRRNDGSGRPPYLVYSDSGFGLCNF